MEILYGLHAVEEALRADRRKFERLAADRDRKDQRLAAIVELARSRGVRVDTESRAGLTQLARTDAHQGAVLIARGRDENSLEDLLAAPEGHALFLLALDGVEDPQNLGALLRTADGAGADGVILPERRSAPVNATVAKASAGASEHVRTAHVVNINRALEMLKKNHVWCVGLDERGDRTYDEFDFTLPFALVLGREGAGLHEQTRKHCDFLLRIPMAGAVASLNVSAAGAVVMYEAARQRRIGRDANPPQPKPQKPQRGLGS